MQLVLRCSPCVVPVWRIMQPLWRMMQPLWRGRMQVRPVSGTLSRQGDILMGGDLNPIGQRVKKKDLRL